MRALARRHRVHRRTVRQALAGAVPPARKLTPRPAPALDPYRATIRAWLTADLAAPRKQRHTARRVWQRLVDEHGATVSESTVRAYVGPGQAPSSSRARAWCACRRPMALARRPSRLRQGLGLSRRCADRAVHLPHAPVPLRAAPSTSPRRSRARRRSSKGTSWPLPTSVGCPRGSAMTTFLPRWHAC